MNQTRNTPKRHRSHQSHPKPQGGRLPSFNLKTLNPKKLYFLPLGGSGEIGMNANFYHYDGRWLMVDLGVTFDQVPGVEVIMPDLSGFSQCLPALDGIILTHAHEDHFGAIPYLWQKLKLKCPIYATPFTAYLLRKKMEEKGVRDYQLKEFPLSGQLEIGPFSVRAVSLTHSIPEPNGLCITTKGGTVFHTGDWKIDAEPLIGGLTDVKSLNQIGDQGVDLIVCDSTSVLEQGHSGSEEDVRETLIDLLAQRPKGNVVISCFASNVARVSSCAVAAARAGRTPFLMGRSLLRFDEAARACGYFKSEGEAHRVQKVPPFANPQLLKKIEPDKTLIVATGSQGEERAALHRMAIGAHPQFRLEPGDTVIFSSRIIPGNEKQIYKLQNRLVDMGVHVITHKEARTVHVSGHPSRDELRDMYTWTKPKKAIPVHGEIRHLEAHGEFARSMGVEALVPRNGDVILVGPGPMKKVGKVHSGRLGCDGRRIISMDGAILEERSLLGEHGVVSISVIFQKGLFYDCYVSFMGIFEGKDSAYWTQSIGETIQRLSGEGALEAGEENLRSMIVREVGDNLRRRTEKQPAVIVHIYGGSA